ncbi:YolD-like family protein [Mechercharimyces sp. CAU 1602]|uniref:YolD-like family protein n=1 Tax=Mechercharimyces sp. CAU 1602 TaxID=2973933 RepID=UPI002162943D|nr:YolD-like family protein [Mechercharimyces sp. CAU 1602]MCS1350044.1 YolD-like family protein [Mechercharimyces sp. CAU 1602]
MSRVLERGNKMWEGHRMILPEHVDHLHEQNRAAKKYQAPDLSEDAIREIGFAIEKSMVELIPVLVQCAGKYGIESYEGVITSINAIDRYIRLQGADHTEHISFQTIVNVETRE